MRKHRKKRTGKYILLALVILIAAGAAGVHYFLSMGKNSEAAKEYEKQITAETQAATDKRVDEVEQITQQVLAELGEAQGGEAAGDGESGGEGSEPPSGGESAGGEAASGSQGGGSGEGTQAQKPQQTEAERQKALEEQKQALTAALKEKYYEVLESQKQDALGMVNGLLAQGKSDYKALVAAGKKTPASLGNLITEYMAKVDVMESNMDQSFEATVGKMEEQLSVLGIDGAEIVTEYRAQYKSIKEANRQYFMDKAWDAFMN